MHFVTRPESALLLAMMSLGACTGNVRFSDETLASVVRDVGFSCKSVVDARVSDASQATWRVACAGAETYLASVQDNGQVCVEPLLLGDGGPAPQIVQSPEQRCATP
jgi:hypothetical protein